MLNFEIQSIELVIKDNALFQNSDQSKIALRDSIRFFHTVKIQNNTAYAMILSISESG